MTGWHASTRLPRDHYVRLDSNDYSVHPGAVGRRVDVAAGLERVVVTCDGKVVADHPRSWAKHQSFTDPDHATAAAALRRAHVAALSARAGAPAHRRAGPGPDQLRHRPGHPASTPASTSRSTPIRTILMLRAAGWRDGRPHAPRTTASTTPSRPPLVRDAPGVT